MDAFATLKSEPIVSVLCVTSAVVVGYRASACASESAIPSRASMCIVAHMVVMMVGVVATTIDVVNSRWIVVEVVHSVNSVHGIEPCVGSPYHRTEEVVGCSEQCVLPIVKDMT